ncbi:cytochrome P450 76C2-like isoform X2 [Silene latifolia]|uniref:cytochrome P450 76C2-like isoform X2 n=1 Tax=Silene latifolia TaxID=37657 RepID=UPI003D78108D
MWSRWWSASDVTSEFGGRFILTGVTALSLLFFILFVKTRGKGKSPSPPGPTGLPFVGYLPFLGSDLRYTFKDLANIYGPIFKVRLGTKDGIVITSASLAKEVLRDKDVIFSNRDPTVAAKTALTKLDDPATSLTLAQVKGILTDAIIGGVDTTATTVEWAMTELLRHPEILKNAQEELTAKIGLDNTVEEGHVGELKYLNAIVKETLRMHPPVPFFVPHCPDRDTTIGGYNIRKNSQIYINTWAIHRDPQFWEAPLEFRPERFSNDCEKLDFFGKQFHYLPFGSGRRMCTGISLAEKTSMFVLASLLHSFEWKLPNDANDVDLSETFGIVVKKSKPLMAVPSPRFSNLELYSM